jgi:hypothetical protein
MEPSREVPSNRLPRKHGRTLVVTLAAMIVLAAVYSVTADFLRTRPMRTEPDDRPIEVAADGYISSDNCRSCHPSEYNSWYGSYHRTMTQPATLDTVKGDFEKVELELDGNRYLLRRVGDEYWVEMNQAGVESRHQIVLVTGSHHMQVYWYPKGEQRALSRVPFTFLLGVGWVPFRSVFVRPPDENRPVQVQHTGTGSWNDTCLNCHTTHGRPRIGFDGSYDTQVAEFGIACESCHGPSEDHIRINRSPLRRYAQYLKSVTDPTITQPKVLSQKLASEVCAHCHGIFQFRDVDAVRNWKKSGFEYRPGGSHEKSQYLFQPSLAEEEPIVEHIMKNDPGLVNSYFWSDGKARSSAREYNDMIETGCYKRGEMTCMSCHSMHKKADDTRSLKIWANDQLSPDMDGDQACLQCHDSYAKNVESHTHHQIQSEGSRCYNCHMPKTDYGLLKTQRDHYIDSPGVAESVSTGRPNACNLCHLDRTLEWTAGRLSEWYNIESPELDADEREVSASVLWALSGDPGVRAIMASAMGWQPAREASKGDWMVPFLGVLMDDPYDAVRHIAVRSLRTFQDFEKIDFDSISRPHDRNLVVPQIVDIFSARGRHPQITPQMLLTPEGALNDSEVTRLIQQRDPSPFVVYE